MTLQESGVLGLTCVVTGLSVEYNTQSSKPAEVDIEGECTLRCRRSTSPVVDVVALPWTESSHTADDVQLLVLVNNTAATNKSALWLLRILSIPGSSLFRQP